jgi:hypothetical protein
VRHEQRKEGNALTEREKIIRQQAIENNLTLREWASEQEVNVGGFEDQAAPQETFEYRPTEHDQGATEERFVARQLADEFLIAKMEQESKQTNQRGKPNEFGWTPQVAAKIERSPL